MVSPEIEGNLSVRLFMELEKSIRAEKNKVFSCIVYLCIV